MLRIFKYALPGATNSVLVESAKGQAFGIIVFFLVVRPLIDSIVSFF